MIEVICEDGKETNKKFGNVNKLIISIEGKNPRSYARKLINMKHTFLKQKRDV